MGEFSLMHWVVVLGIGLLFFGPKKLPQLGQSIGKAFHSFKSGLNDLHEDINKEEEPQSIKERVVETPKITERKDS